MLWEGGKGERGAHRLAGLDLAARLDPAGGGAGGGVATTQQVQPALQLANRYGRGLCHTLTLSYVVTLRGRPNQPSAVKSSDSMRKIGWMSVIPRAS